MSAGSLYSVENPVFQAFLKYGGLVLAKTIAMSVVTGAMRVGSKSFSSPEDARNLAGNDPEKLKRYLQPNPNVERVRRIHLNDIENVYAFVMIALAYIAIAPEASTAILLFKVFAGVRFAHTFIYYMGLQPFRAISFFLGFAVNAFMLFQILSTVW